jgi:DNA-binding transcriptional regulator YiaG/DNA-binding XRE family transcriptional regulator
MESTNKLNECNIDLKVKDLRRLSKEEFLDFAKQIKELTKNFTEFEQVIKDKSQVLLIFRCLAGMQRKEFANAIGINEEILRQVEVDRREIKKESKINEISKNLEEIFSKISEISVENALELFKEVAIPTDNEKVEKIRSELEKMGLPEDLRKMDEEQFLKVLEWLKEKTNNFKIFPEEVFLAKNQLILILRCAGGMTRPSFARKVGINQETLRFIEMNRKENRIRTLGVAKRWCEKITNFLKLSKIEVDKEKSILLWRIIREKQTGEKDVQKENEIKEMLKNLQLPQDLREMNENQFINLFNKIKEITNDFTQIPVELITARSDIILILRLATGLSRKGFCTKTGIRFDTLKRVERGKIHIKNGAPAFRWISVFSSLFNENSNKINLEKALKAFKALKGEVEAKEEEIKPIMKMNIDEVKEFFKKIRDETENFTKISFDKIRDEPRIISVIRILLNKSIPEFSKIIGKDESWLRRWENGKVKLNIKSSIFLSNKLKELIKEVNISEENFIKNFIDLHHVKPNEINENVKKVLKALKKVKPTKSEQEVINVLEELNIPFTIHANVNCFKRIENFDIAIPDEKSPFCLIEITETKKFNGNLRTKVLVTDHKFQMIKSVAHDVKTICFVKINDKHIIKDRVKDMIKTELLNTDFLFINELDELKKFLQSLNFSSKTEF